MGLFDHVELRRETDWEKSTQMRLSSTNTFCILKYACSASSRLSNSMNAYCRESPVFLSRITWQLMIGPKRENMSSRSSSRVTGLSLHTKRTFSGGRTLAKGRSPTISNVNAAARAACFRRSASASSSGNVASGSSSSAMRVELSGGRVGTDSGTTSPEGSSNGSSKISTCLILTSLRGLPSWSVKTSFSWSSVSSPYTTWPNTACFPSR